MPSTMTGMELVRLQQTQPASFYPPYDPTPSARLDNTQALIFLTLESIIQQIQNQDQQQHLTSPPKDTSPQYCS